MLAESAKSVGKGTPIELRCRYDCEPGGEAAAFSTEFSNVLSVSAEAMQVGHETAPAETTAAAVTTRAASAQSTQQKALGWLWILLIVFAVFVLLIIIFLLTRKNKEDKK
jgi:disulfide bond formation protein DsbB